MSGSIIECLSRLVGTETKHLAATDASEACGASNQEESQRLHGENAVSGSAFLGARLAASDTRIERKGSHRLCANREHLMLMDDQFSPRTPGVS
jgi:hypothetical protein